MIFRYAIDKEPREVGICMDLDKGVLLDRGGDAEAETILEQCHEALWTIAREARALVDNNVVPVDIKRNSQLKWTTMIESASMGFDTGPRHSMA